MSDGKDTIYRGPTPEEAVVMIGSTLGFVSGTRQGVSHLGMGGGGIGAVSVTGQELPKVPQISEQGIKACFEHANRVHERLNDLEERLCPCLTPAEPEPVNSDTMKIGFTSPLGEQVLILARNIEHAEERIIRLMERLEL